MPEAPDGRQRQPRLVARLSSSDAILNAIHQLTKESPNKTFTAGQVAQMSDLSTRRVRQDLLQMVADGLLERPGGNRKRILYVLADGFSLASLDAEMVETKPPPGPLSHTNRQSIFISYVKEDWPTVSRLVGALRRSGFEPWVDRESLGAGQYWRTAIRNAIREGAAVVACFSTNYALRSRTYMNEELTLVADELRMRPPESMWFFPVRLNNCVIPEKSMGGGYMLSDIQYVDLFPEIETGAAKLITGLHRMSDERA